MSRYSAQILICFIAYIFLFFYSSVGLVGNFARLPVCTMPSAIVHCNQNEAYFILYIVSNDENKHVQSLMRVVPILWWKTAEQRAFHQYPLP